VTLALAILNVIIPLNVQCAIPIHFKFKGNAAGQVGLANDISRPNTSQERNHSHVDSVEVNMIQRKDQSDKIFSPEPHSAPFA